MSINRFFRRLRWSSRLNGPFGLMGSVAVRVRRRLSGREPDEAFYFARDRYFDHRFAVDTAGCIEVDEMDDVATDAKVHMVEYRPIPATDLAMAISDALSLWSAETIRAATFVDLGCGKGRGLLVAGQFPFQACLGVELSRQIADAAKANLARANVRPVSGPLTVVHGDASVVEFPDTPICLYMFNPFNEPIVREVEQRLRQSLGENPRPALVVYGNAQHADIFRESPVWRSQTAPSDWWAFFDTTPELIEADTVDASIDPEVAGGS